MSTSEWNNLPGQAGTSGTSGSSGTTGTSGTSGSTGTHGTSGTTGTSGTSGSSGSSGSDGTFFGSSGTSGTSGADNTTNVTAAAVLTDNALIRGDGGARGVQTSTVLVSDAGEMTNPSQPAFLAYNSATDENVTGDGTAFTVIFDTEVKDQGNDFASNTFTAPVTGMYPLFAMAYLTGLANDHLVTLILTTSNRNYVDVFPAYSTNSMMAKISQLVDMDAGDTAYVSLGVTGGSKTVDVVGGAFGYTSFGGFLAC